MATITEESEQERHHQPKTSKRTTKSKTEQNPKPKIQEKLRTQTQSSSNPFIFWFYFTLAVSLITLTTLFLSSLSSPKDPKSFFLSLSAPLRQHYSKGRTIKVQLSPDRPLSEVFALESGNGGGVTEKVVIVPGLGLSSYSFRTVVDFLGSNAVQGVAFDLPGNGFSDKSMEVEEEKGNVVFERFKDVYGLIKEKGIFWAFDNMVESGQIPFEEIQGHFDKRTRTVHKPVVLGNEETGRVLVQIIETMDLAPVHLVLHDSSLSMVANWVVENKDFVRSLTLVDTGSRPALPLCVLNIPILREIALGFNFLYDQVVRSCCSRGIKGLELVGNRVMLAGRDGIRTVAGMGKNLNTSFDITEWGSLDGVKEIPMQVIWSQSWSKEWSEEGRRVAEALPQAKFVTHSGGRWPQEDSSAELADHIVKFVTSLPKSVRLVEEETIPEHIQQMLDEAKQNGHHHHHHHGHGSNNHHHHHHGGHDHSQGAGYMDGYGLGQGWMG